MRVTTGLFLRMLTLLGVVVFMGSRPPALDASNLAAAAAFHCEICGMDDGMSNHRFGGHVACSGGGICFDCHEFNACHGDYQPGFCTAWHNQCDPSFALSAKEEKMVIAAVDSADAGPLLKLMKERPSLVSFNEDRSVIQMFNCKGMVIANLPVTESFARTLSQ